MKNSFELLFKHVKEEFMRIMSVTLMMYCTNVQCLASVSELASQLLHKACF